MRRRLMVGVVIPVLVVFCVLQVLATPGSSQTNSEEAAVRQAVVRAIEANWNLLLDPESDLEHCWDLTRAGSLQALAKEREVFRRHYAEPAKKAGFRYTGVVVAARFQDVILDGASAQVRVVVDVEYTSEYPGDPTPIVSRVANDEHTIELVNRGGGWLVVSDSYFQMFSKRGTTSLTGDSEGPEGLEPNQAILAPPGIYGVLHHYNRAGAVEYADYWWNKRNTKYLNWPPNCANFVSQSFREGGLALMGWAGPYVWWYDFMGTPHTYDDAWSFSWSVAHDQAYHLSRNQDLDEMRGTYVDSAHLLGLGESIYCDLTGDGILDHSAIVVEIRNGQPYVNYHTRDSYHVYWDLGAFTRGH